MHPAFSPEALLGGCGTSAVVPPFELLLFWRLDLILWLKLKLKPQGDISQILLPEPGIHHGVLDLDMYWDRNVG